MISVKNLCKRYGPFEALKDATFEVAKGEVVGFLGPNGAGKTTTMKILTGFLRKTSGEARIAGTCVESDPLKVQRQIGYLPESAPLYRDMQPLEYLRFCGEVRRIPRKERERSIEAVADRCAIRDVLRVPIGHLSKGYRQRVGLAQALLHGPELMILDEPTTGLDPNQLVEIRALLKELGKEKTIILSTHILREVEATCNRVIIVSQGQIVADDSPENLSRGEAVLVTGPDAAKDAEAVFRAGPFAGVEALSVPAGFRLRLQPGELKDPGAEAYRIAAAGGLTLSELKREAASLEDVFHQLTK